MKNNTENTVAIIGAGPMGLGAAYELGKKGIKVDIYEAGSRPGGMTASFDFDGIEIERFFHFICATDYDYFRVLDELGIGDRLHWVNTRMGYFYNGRMCNWGDPISLLAFPGLTLIDKFRYGLHVLYCKQLQGFDDLDKLSATSWLKKWLGERAYKILWDPLMSLKFYELQDKPSAAWIAARIQRVGQSRESLFKEKTGYLTGCSETLIHAMTDAINEQGSSLNLGQSIDEVLVKDGRVSGVRVNGEVKSYQKVIVTVPLPYVSRLIPGLPDDDHEKLSKVESVAVVCLMFKLDRAFSPYFWLNINTPGISMPGIIEYTNLNPLNGKDHILYIPYYMPSSNPKYAWTDKQFYEEVLKNFRIMRPDFHESWIGSFKASRYQYAQPVCVPEYLKKIPPMKSQVGGLYMADTSYYYPQDRSITESLKTGLQLAELALSEA